MQLAGARLRGVGDEPAAGVAVLCGEGILHNRHFTHRRIRDRALLCLLMAFCVSECRTVKPVLGGHRLAAIHARSELASTENSIAVGLHGHVAGLKLQQ